MNLFDFSLMKDKFLPYYKAIGKNVKRLRLEQKLTQLELANKCSVNREEISRIENASRDYMLSTLFEVSEALEIPIHVIMSQPSGNR